MEIYCISSEEYRMEILMNMMSKYFDNGNQIYGDYMVHEPLFENCTIKNYFAIAMRKINSCDILVADNWDVALQARPIIDAQVEYAKEIGKLVLCVDSDCKLGREVKRENNN